MFCLFFTGKVLAAPVPIPESGRIKCPDINGEDPNFNSSRPYQASPCGDSPKAVMCGNSLQVIEDTPSRRAAAGTPFLDVEMVMQQKQYAADVTGATFPIAGNTELTKNSQSTEDQIDDATRVNEYLNWYLNGTTDRAENGVTDTNKIVDYAGPVRKLLPGVIQDAQRLVTIKNLYESADYATDEPQNPGDHPGPTELIHDDAITHDQIVVCTENAVRVIPLWLSNLLDLPTLGVETPTECYPNEGSPADGSAFRLDMWSQPNEIGELVSKASQYIPIIFPGIISQLLADISNHWPKRYPPLPWSDQDGQPFETYKDYQKAYNEWRGQLCTFVPNIFGGEKMLICVGAWPILTNPYADLYSYVPLSNTVDKNAKTPITGVGINGIGGTEVRLPGIAYEIIQDPVLFYPHTAEVSELSDILNTTYIPKEGTTHEIPSDSTEPLNDPETNKCRIVNLRSNPGDYLFPEVDPSEVRVEVKEYLVTRIPCHDVTRYDERRGIEITYALCRGQVAIEIRMITKVPYAKEIYDSTTAGADSTFRRIYPKVEAGAPVTCISNIPSVTNVQYIPTENMDEMKVIGPLGDNTTDNPQLYFPHFGSVYDYFLKGIQTALRPKGYGEPTPESGTLCETVKPVDCEAENVPDSAVPSNLLGGFKSNFIDLANRWSATCPGAENNMAEKCYNYVASEAKKAGVNPAFALTIWLNESGASNYCESGSTAQDFGINLPALYQNIGEQLKVFLNMAKMKLCDGESGFTEPMHGWLSRFQSSAGVCNPNDAVATSYYNEVMTTTWTWVSGCTKGGKFGITWPTDTSCP
jgi:hypothetical protein